MNVLFTSVSNYINDTTAVNDYLKANTVRGFFFQNLQLNVFDTNKVMPIVNQLLLDFLKELRPELMMVVETDYVDKVYRDSYYSYFSTKLKEYGRNCLRVSFFEPVFKNKTEFFSLTRDDAQSAYRGFLVVRPLAKCIGRNAIDIRAKQTVVKDACIREADIDTTCLGIKLTVHAFPHASQDEEYMTCAETTVWSIMEYYGNKYPIHNPLLPTDIHSSIKISSFKRQVPSTGLRLEQISLALQQHGFGCMVYEKSNPRFQELFACYVESGLPLAVVVGGTWGKHAIVCVGRPRLNRTEITKAAKPIAVDYIFWNQNEDFFVFNDDNSPCYQVYKFDTPTPYFGPSEITHFIVPLYKKIYLPAEQAIDKSNFFVENDFHAPAGSYVRTFLTSSRSYREYIKFNTSIPDALRESYLSINLPKFIWVTEVTYSTADFVNNKVNAFILLDATGMTTEKDVYSSLIMKQGGNILTIFDQKDRLFKNFSIPSLPASFESFPGNI